MRSHHRVIFAALFCAVAATVLSAQPAAQPIADQRILLDDRSSVAEWPTIAENQAHTPRPREIVTNGPPADTQCQNPCVGGTGCTGWESVENSYCRNINGITYDCQSTGGSQYCMKKTLSSGLISCMTCIN
jgi:hypothetical protein